MEVLNEYGQILLILAIIFGLFMAWGVGANDVANAMGTSVGSGAITLKQAIVIAWYPKAFTSFYYSRFYCFKSRS